MRKVRLAESMNGVKTLTQVFPTLSTVFYVLSIALQQGIKEKDSLKAPHKT